MTFEEIAASTDGYSGSDLKELLRVAGIQRLKRVLATIPDEPPRHAASTLPKSTPKEFSTPIIRSDVEYALRKTASNDDIINHLKSTSNSMASLIASLSNIASKDSKKSKSKGKKSPEEDDGVAVSDA